MVIKAVSEQGERLNIRKATLRTWRADFASKLRDLGVPANATERAVRGQNRSPKLDTIYRAERRDDCRRTSERVERIANELLTGRLNAEVGREKMRATRRSVVHGWLNIANVLDAAGRPDLAEQVRKFLITVPPPRTENETIAASILQRNYDRQAQHNR